MRLTILTVLFAAMIPSAAMAADFAAGQAQDGNVVEFRVLSVAVPSKLPNYCAVTALVGKVWQGTDYRPGQPLLLNVPCAEYGLIPANVRHDGFIPVNAKSLEQSQRGIARLDDKGALIWNHEGLRPYGPWGAVAGYRVLDARMLPAPVRS
jgi:hypothetical protein